MTTFPSICYMRKFPNPQTELVHAQKTAWSTFANEGLKNLFKILINLVLSRKMHWYATHYEMLLKHHFSAPTNLWLMDEWSLPHPQPTKHIPASKNHRRSDNPRVLSWPVTGAGKNVWGNCPVKTNEQRITEHTQLKPRKILNSIHLHSQPASEHTPGTIQKPAPLSGAVKHKNLFMCKVF